MNERDWLEGLEPDEREAWDEFVEHFRRDALSKMAESAFVAQLVPDRERFDVKFAVELGASIMLDKPILAIVMPGVEVPRRLRQVADVIVEADLDTEEGRQRVAGVVSEFTKEFC